MHEYVFTYIALYLVMLHMYMAVHSITANFIVYILNIKIFIEYQGSHYLSSCKYTCIYVHMY